MIFGSQLFKDSFRSGLRKGLDGYIWMMRIVVPASLFTAILAWSDLLHYIDFLIQPVLSLIYLPAIAAIPLIIGILTGIYGGIAAMAVLSFTYGQMVVMAVFLLICHNMIQEGIIQGQSGIGILKATLFRFVAGFITVIIVAQFLDMAPLAGQQLPGVIAQPPFMAMIGDWAITMLELAIKIFFIIMTILTALEIMKAFGWIKNIVRSLSPVLRVMGLSEKVGILWMTAVVFGLAYGGAVIVEEAKAGHLTSEELEMLHLSIGINHSMVEDPSLFLSLGLNPFWLWIPRLIMAIVAVRILTLWQKFCERRKVA